MTKTTASRKRHTVKSLRLEADNVLISGDNRNGIFMEFLLSISVLLL